MAASLNDDADQTNPDDTVNGMNEEENTPDEVNDNDEPDDTVP